MLKSTAVYAVGTEASGSQKQSGRVSSKWTFLRAKFQATYNECQGVTPEAETGYWLAFLSGGNAWLCFLIGMSLFLLSPSLQREGGDGKGERPADLL